MSTKDRGHLRVFEALGFHQETEMGSQAVGICPFCGSGKFYVNMETGQWDCKIGSCSRSGNVYSFIEQIHAQWREDTDEALYLALSEDRGIRPEILESVGVVWDASEERWAIPVTNRQDKIVNFRFYKPGQKLMGLPEMETHLFGLNWIDGNTTKIWLCEGEWDTMAMTYILALDGRIGEEVAIGTPGCNVFKATWAKYFTGKDVIIAFDHDEAGDKGTHRTGRLLENEVATLSRVVWEDDMPEGYDLRDFISTGCTLEALEPRVMEFIPLRDPKDKSAAPKPVLLAALSNQPDFETVILPVFRQWMNLGPDLEIALRLIVAVTLANQIPGDPLWAHIIGPPSSGKTELLRTLDGCATAVFQSSLTPNCLVSGFRMSDGSDPSLLSRVDGKTLILKDLTEVFGMDKQQQQEIFSVLRGAYDGSVERQYGNGMRRVYTLHFNLLTGVTPVIYGRKDSTLGERFLMFHISKEPRADRKAMIRKALSGGGDEEEMRAAMSNAVRSYVDVTLPPDAIPECSDAVCDKIVALAEIVSQLRAGVEYDQRREELSYRPSSEMPIRVAKQLQKLARGLALLEPDRSVNERVYRIVARVALDSCIGFHLDIISALMSNPDSTVSELVESLSIPDTTVRRRVDDLYRLKCVTYRPDESKRANQFGPTPYAYSASSELMEIWAEADLHPEDFSNTPETRAEIAQAPQERTTRNQLGN